MMTRISRIAALLAGVLLATARVAQAGAPGDPAAVSSADGEYFDRDSDPTFKITKDGTVDWYTYSGYVRYTANCMQCHGPDGLGSSYAPSLVDAAKALGYADFLSVVANGKQDVNAAQQLAMPAFGTSRNVMCYVDPLYVYLRALAGGALGRGRPDKHAAKPNAFAKAEDACMG